MSARCVSGKRIFASQQLAEDTLIELWAKNEYTSGQAPVAVYRCEDCGQYHLTSKGPMNGSLAKAIESGQIKREREANKWLDKFRKM